jgi:hypothetical protein
MSKNEITLEEAAELLRTPPSVVEKGIDVVGQVAAEFRAEDEAKRAEESQSVTSLISG